MVKDLNSGFSFELVNPYYAKFYYNDVHFVDVICGSVVFLPLN